MRFLSLLSLGALALFWNACEKQPLAGDPHPGVHEAHGPVHHEGDAPHPVEPVKPAAGAKDEAAPKFFPEKK